MRRLAAFALFLPAFLAACVPQERPRYQPPLVETTPAAPQPLRARWQPGAVVTDARRVEEQAYTVRAGDSLSVIAERTGSGVERIAAANDLSPPYTIFPGQVLRIPGGRYHSVNRGETGIAIALAYRIDWDRIVTANDLKPPFLLRVGQKLLLPEDAPPQRADVPDRRMPDSDTPTRMAAFDIDIDDIISGGEPAETATATVPREIEPFDGRFAWPVQGRLISGFGAKAGGLYNDGINIAAAAGQPVRAAASGTVIYAGNGIEGWGNLILIKHDEEWVSAYAHNDAFYVERGDRVNRGDRIADVGQTGTVDRPQLHFELRQGRRPLDPRKFLPAA
ncbi:MAG: M23 family metallopeptidase [Pacificimonas sp.]|nr:M23 family metallopeptidase [Pacificimonas sp.]